MSACINLTSLRLTAIGLTDAWIGVIASLKHLDTLSVHRVTVPDELKPLIAMKDLPLFSSVFNIKALSAKQDVWYLAALCPQLRVLNLIGFTRDSPCALPDTITMATHMSILATVERLSLEVVDNYETDDLLDFCVWIQLCSQHAPHGVLPLTHLNITTRFQMTIPKRNAILFALQCTKLHALMLGNVAHTRPNLFRAIARSQPELRSLIVTRRPTEFHDETHASIWPGSSWEYAQALAPLRHLVHFGWNNYFENMTAAPSDLLFMENGYPKHFCKVKSDDLYILPHEEYGLPHLFAAYCPSLQSSGVFQSFGPLCSVRWKLKRKEEGKLEVSVEAFASEKANFCPTDDGWPTVHGEKGGLVQETS